jgi:hypothetical protein
LNICFVFNPQAGPAWDRSKLLRVTRNHQLGLWAEQAANGSHGLSLKGLARFVNDDQIKVATGHALVDEPGGLGERGDHHGRLEEFFELGHHKAASGGVPIRVLADGFRQVVRARECHEP